MNRVERASGKVILLGEHAVVYGAPALAAGIERGATATAELAPHGEESELVVEGDDFVVDARSQDDLNRAFAALLSTPSPLAAVRVRASVDLPVGGGLGSSAALGVAIARAALAVNGLPLDNREVIARATAWERIFHGNPSGIDATAAALGGCFRFVRPDHVTNVPPARSIRLVIASSGMSSSTRTMVEGLATLREKEPTRVNEAIDAIGREVHRASDAITTGDLVSLGAAMDRNQTLLDGLSLSSATLENMCGIARRAGALGAKLTGKGGGGSIIALVDSEASAEQVLSALRSEGFEGFQTQIAARNVSP